MRRNKFILALSFCLAFSLVKGQSPSPVFFEMIRDDSAMIFFNERYHLTEKACATYNRYTRVENNGDFNSYFEDLSGDNLLLGRGTYVHGKKHGYFEIYHPNGKLECKGNYKDNKPVGRWEYFYENGLPERTLEIDSTGTRMIRFLDKNGNIKVSDGNGVFSGIVEGLNSRLTAKGKITEGRPEGKWTSTVDGIEYCNEWFENGKFVNGKFPRALMNNKYSDKSYLNTFFVENYVTFLEKFIFEKCADSVRNSVKKYNFNVKSFETDIQRRIRSVIESNQRYGIRNSTEGKLIIQFAVNKDGRAEDLSMASTWGSEYSHTIIGAIKSQVRFPPTKVMYFHLNISLGQNFIRTDYRFSRDPY
ncbi:MAG: hypothetical protein QM734_17790 [Cyclobacteriaceae bacterium]